MYAKKKLKGKGHGDDKKDNTAKLAAEPSLPRTLGDYQLVEAIGRGGFGIVYRGIHLTTGRTVAVKRVGLQGIPAEELEGIESEIRLLQNLSHPNIVKYLDSIRTDEHLNIILEYVENGSLSSLLNKMDNKMPEPLVCHYVAQVLRGLTYLHTQGVIHRDIKGANILSTKEGTIKLADFGVATKLNESRKSDSVVGTPYWMAPEIIEMTGQQSSACDIWSVGCTAIELFTGKPPYFDLPQMSALFRIVQDEHPPMPDNATRAFEDFLIQCFQKDPNRRIEAPALLKHPWIKSAVEKLQMDEDVADGMIKPKTTRIGTQPPPASTTKTAGKGLMDRAKTVDVPSGNDEGSDSDWDAEIDDIPESNKSKPKLTLNEDDESEDPFASDDEELASKAQKMTISNTKVSAHNDKKHLKFGVNTATGPNKPVPAHLLSPTASSKMKNAVTQVVSAAKNLKNFQEVEDDAEFDEIDDAAINIPKFAKKDFVKDVIDEKEEDEATDQDDPFDDITFEEDRTQDENLAVTKAFMRVIEQFTPKNDQGQILEACEKLNDMGKKNPDQVRSLMTHRGVIPIMEMLQVQNHEILLAVLKVVNEIVAKNPQFQQSMSLVGLIPAIIRFGSLEFPTEIRMQAASFVRQFCYASDFTRKMFIACDGLPVLVSFLQEEYLRSKTLVWNAIDCIRHVFDITSNPKNDFCRLFCKFGLLQPLTKALQYVNADKESSDAYEYVSKIAKILHLFSEGDAVVKAHFAKPAVIENMLKVLPELKQEILILVLKAIKNITMDPSTLDLLEAAGAIPALVPFLSSPFQENQSQVLQTMYYLCQIKPSRQEQAAVSGLIPHLQRFVRDNHSLKQFAYPIIFLLAKSSNRARTELKKYAGVQFYIDVLKDMYWRTHALEVLAAWLQDDPVKVGFILNTTSNINKLLTCFSTTNKVVQFEKMLPLFRKMLSVSIRVNQSFGKSYVFIQEIKNRLLRHTNSNSIRVNLLKILALVFVAHQSAYKIVKDHDLLPVLIKLSEEKASVIVMSLAQKLVDKCRIATNQALQQSP